MGPIPRRGGYLELERAPKAPLGLLAVGAQGAPMGLLGARDALPRRVGYLAWVRSLFLRDVDQEVAWLAPEVLTELVHHPRGGHIPWVIE